jgi:NAD(P)-dependent dehydrogenase (short-subunit alcohol dehydrogenase family)
MENKPVAIITAAGNGMGKAIAEKLNKEGYRLFLMSRSDNALTLAKSLNQKGMIGDITDKRDLAKLVKNCISEYGRIDALVINTGHPPKGELVELSDEEWQEGMDLVLMNVVRLIRLVTPYMIKQRKGAVVNISTFAALEPSLSFPISSVMRSALSAFIKLYSQRYAGVGIRMNSILPGFIDSYKQSEEILKNIPAGRLGTVNEVADTVAFLLSDGAGYINGQNIPVDGGLSRHI